jgi:CRISPR-associated protein Cmr2
MLMTDIYTAITIGPIYDTISLTSSPVGMWAASYLFSYITRSLCELIIGRKLVTQENDILSPYFSKDNCNNKGIGLYHDRIVFKPADAPTVLTELDKIFDEVASKVAAAFDNHPAEWFRQYLQLHALNFKSYENPILDCSKYLDALELEMTFPTGKNSNPLKDLFEHKQKNKEIRERIRDKFSEREWPFSVTGSELDDDAKAPLKDMEHITGRWTETQKIEAAKKDTTAKSARKKINSYYAIVHSDGDRFGEYIKKYIKKSDPRQFSKSCLTYCSAASEKIQYYGGVTIYAGGDDLLFIAPLVSPNCDSKNLLSLIEDLRDSFGDIFSADDPPTLSFGIAIRYYKYPLYEAFSEVYDLLFRQAKATRNAAAISLQKHSGQAVNFVLKDFTAATLTERIKKLIDKQMNDEVLQSIRGKIWEFQELFAQALLIGGTALKNVFTNTFDSAEIHNIKSRDINDVYELLEALPCSDEKDKLKLLDKLLRFVKFWREEGED